MKNLLPKKKPYLIAEIGGNHEGDFDYALDLCQLAIESGADCIKFQIYCADDLVNPFENPDRFAHFKKFELTPEQHIKLAKLCIDSSVDYLASVWGDKHIKYIDKFCRFYKIGSGDLTNYPLISNFAQLGKPLILSTGLSTFDEVSQTVEFIRRTNPSYKKQNMIALLQCTSMYPIPFEDSNLAVMRQLAKIENVQIGYSDHTIGDQALYLASILGAEILEFHFTDSRQGKSFRDHKVSLTCNEVKELIKKINTSKLLIGSDIKKPLRIEVDTNHLVTFRRALYPKQNLSKGHIFKEGDLLSLRPCHGISSAFFEDVIGMKLKRDINKLEPMSFDDLESPD
tara:strand:- start:44 stop:1066 length:1023 start_codon:yes stop_codon:yes gene_type:complete